MRKLIAAVFLWVISVFVWDLLAATVTSAQAEKAVGAWLSKGKSLDRTLGRSVVSSQTLSATNGATFHVVRLADRGFVVTSGDTKLEPVIAYSAGTTFDVSDENPLWVLVRKDMALRAAAAGVVPSGSQLKLAKSAASSASSTAQTAEERKWAELLEEEDPLPTGMARKVNTALDTVPDVRVAPLLKSTWGQDTVGSKNVYNRYTPNNYVCGCVATVGAQIMRFFEWPKTSMAQYTCDYCKVDGVKKSYTTQAGLYDWTNMPLSPTSSITDTEREAIGKLTSDVGITCGMKYKSGGSSAGGYMLQRAFVENFGYSNAIAMQKDGNCTVAETKNALVSNFDAGLPVAVSIGYSFKDGGHEIVGDGYGYSDETLYYHFNMGWSGSENVWYAPPALQTSNYAYDVLDGFVYNIYTNQTKDAVIVSGRVLTSAGVSVVGATVTVRQNSTTVATKTTNDKGIYAFVLPAGAYSIVAEKLGSTNSRSVTLAACVTLDLCTGSSFGSYYTSPTPAVGNKCDQDIELNGLASVAEPQISPTPVGGLFYPSTNVTIACSTAGAVIRYTLDGSEPTESSAVYGGPIFIDDTTTVKARAYKSGMNPSAVETMTYVYDASQGAPKGDYFDNPINISGMSGSRTIDDLCDCSKESDEPRHSLVGTSSYKEYQSVWYKWTAQGSGTMTFTTYSSGSYYVYYTVVAIYEGTGYADLVRKAMSKDFSGDYSTTVSVDVEQGKTYRIVGVTLNDVKDDTTAEMTLSWNGDLMVTEDETPVTAEVPIPVKYDWLAQYYPSAPASGYADLAKTVGANGRSVWESYLLGLDPTSAESDFKITSFSLVNGEPVIESNVNESRVESFGYECKVKGTADLTSGIWADKSPTHRYFKVVVEPK